MPEQGADASELLFTDAAWVLPDDLYSCVQARGLYSPLQFVLRLRPDVHRALNSAPAGVVTGLTSEQVFAFSTYLHETIHWWQHIGSTSGFMLSLLYPAQAHSTYPDLIATLPHIGPIAPLRVVNTSSALQKLVPDRFIEHVNRILNNWHDIEFCRRLIVDPGAAHRFIDDPYFESVGHSYWIALAAVLAVLTSTVDPEHHLFPDFRNWEAAATHLHALETSPVPNGRTVEIPPLGAKEIFEGQARISQIQYLQHAGGMRHTWSDFKAFGMLDGMYVQAFDTFLTISSLPEPTESRSHTVSLFLLICDLAVNPIEGLLADIVDFDLFVRTIDPGWRFISLCAAVRESPERYAGRIQKYTAEEYFAVSTDLSEACGFAAPREALNQVHKWSSQSPQLAKLLEEDKTFEFGPANLPVRLFAARFLSFLLQKRQTPQFFCWPGICMTPDGSSDLLPEQALAIFEEHRALFLDKEDGDIYPRTFEDRSEATVHNVFNTFYAWVSTYELTRQWIVGSGEFDYGFGWLSSKHPVAEIREWASSKFREVYGVRIEDFTALKENGV